MRATRVYLVLVPLVVAIAPGCGAAEPPSEPAKPGFVHGSLPKEAVRKVVHAQIGMIKQCANAYARPGENGQILVKFSVRTAGNVTDVEIASSTLDNPRLEKCILAAPQYWHFPPPDGGGIVIVTYPFTIEMSPDTEGKPSVTAEPSPAKPEATPAADGGA